MRRFVQQIETDIAEHSAMLRASFALYLEKMLPRSAFLRKADSLYIVLV